MIRCIAIDDEPLALELLEDNISKIPYLQLVASCDNAIDAMRIMETQSVDLIFLDIQMPGLTGLQFISSMTAKPMVILITAYEKYALEGFNLSVVDYLVKPVSLERFVKACNKAKELYDLKNSSREVLTSPENEYFFVSMDYSQVKISVADVMYIEGLKDYIKIHLKSSSKAIVTRMPMKTVEEYLPARLFVRIHKSYIVSISYITSIRKTSVFVGDTELPVSELYRDAINAITGK